MKRLRPRASPPGRGTSRAFSLIELLVAVACITILALLVATGSQQLRQRAREYQCVRNLNNLGLAVFAYAADHRMTLPPGNSDSQEWFKLNSKSWLLAYSGGGTADAVRPLLRCPGDVTGPPATNYSNYYSYTWNAELLMAFVDGVPAKERTPVPLSKVPRKVLFADAITKGENEALANLYPSAVTSKNTRERISKRHRGGAHLLMGDGHVIWMEQEAAFEPSLYRPEE